MSFTLFKKWVKSMRRQRTILMMITRWLWSRDSSRSNKKSTKVWSISESNRALLRTTVLNSPKRLTIISLILIITILSIIHFNWRRNAIFRKMKKIKNWIWRFSTWKNNWCFKKKYFRLLGDQTIIKRLIKIKLLKMMILKENIIKIISAKML